MLFSALQLLKEPENLAPIRSKIVGDFWDASWRRAPFEECLTFRQLSTLEYDSLIKKKSFTGEKMAALAHAIRRAVSGGQAALANTPQVVPPVTANTPEWKLSDDIPATAAAFLSGFSTLLSKLPPQHIYRTLGTRIIGSLPPLEFAGLWFSTTTGEGSAALIGLSGEGLKKITTRTAHQLRTLMQKEAPELTLHWTTALTGVGCAEETLFKSYYAEDVPNTFGKEFGVVLITALGALPVSLFGKILPHHWSLSPKSAEVIVKALVPSFGERKASALEILSLPFPFYDLEALFEHIHTYGSAKKTPPQKALPKKKAPAKKK